MVSKHKKLTRFADLLPGESDKDPFVRMTVNRWAERSNKKPVHDILIQLFNGYEASSFEYVMATDREKKIVIRGLKSVEKNLAEIRQFLESNPEGEEGEANGK